MKDQSRYVLRSLLAFSLLLLISGVVRADDWSQWRGSQRDGVWREAGVLEEFKQQQLPVRWRMPIGPGYSGPTVADGHVYISDRLTEPNQVERVHCFDAMTGQRKWFYAYPCRYKSVGYPVGPRGCITINNGRAYTLGTMGHFFCFDAATGHVLWQKDMNAEYNIRMPTWGISASPLVEDNLVIVQIGGRNKACLVAFDKNTGSELWRALDDKASYSSPIVINQAGQRVLVCWTAERVVGLDPRSGTLYWSYPFATKMAAAIATPVIERDFLFVSAFFEGSLLLRLDPNELAVTSVWQRSGPSEQKTDSLHCCISTPLVAGDNIYGVDSYGELRCLDLLTGDRIWESHAAVPKARWANAYLIPNGDKVWMFNEQGELLITRLSPEGFREISRASLIEPSGQRIDQRGGVCWAHPAFAYQHVYARNDDELICVDLTADD